jgi:hypothetical protein
VAVAGAGLQYSDQDPELGEDEINVSLELQKPGEKVTDYAVVPVNSTAFRAVNQTYEVEYTEYDFGYFVTSVDGLPQNDTHSWLYAVNNESATTSVNSYRLESGDQVSFKYTVQQEY